MDVQQGDASVIETPKGKTLLIDGGENQLFARYLATRFPGTSKNNPKIIDAIVVSHGDADHFSGLSDIAASESHSTSKKRIFINPQRIYHNGLIKRPGNKLDGKARKETEMFGSTTTKNSQTYVTGLVDDLLQVEDAELNRPFKAWRDTIKHYAEQYDSDPKIKRLGHTSQFDFDFLNEENIKVQVLGPITDETNGKPSLKFLREPPASVADIEGASSAAKGSYSASHTINGHSIILKVVYGNVSFMFAGDLNEEAEDTLVTQGGDITSDVLKVPHHGSADFSNKFFDAVKPFVSIVSSGDENEMKEYIHPRATLMGALGKHSRIDRPLIFVTEMVAFMKSEGWAKSIEPGGRKTSFFAFSKTAYGIVHVRTDGKKIFIYTNSGQKDLKEAYVYHMSSPGAIPVRKNVIIG